MSTLLELETQALHVARSVVVHAEPVDGAYTRVATHAEDDEVSGARSRVADLLP